MAELTSEAEFERLYQEFVRRNGGIPTLGSSDFNTPAEFYNEKESVTLSPSQLSQLQAKQSQYNRQSALNTISDEIASNNFTNPYNIRSQTNINSLNAIQGTEGYANARSLNDKLTALPSNDRDALVSGVNANTGIDLLSIANLVGVVPNGISMFTDLQSHTNEQATDIPGRINEIDQLANLQKSFGEMPNDQCSVFNALMGIMSGSFDGVLGYIESSLGNIISELSNTALVQALANIAGVIGGAIAGTIDAVTSFISPVLGKLKPLLDIASSVVGAVADMAGQIANEIAGLVSMAAEIAAKVAALGLAGAMTDPCKLAVLMNTGSPNLMNAASLLNAPIETPVPNINIPTEVDSRVTPEEVNNAVRIAKESTSTQPGVPQSPTNPLAKLYQPFNAYLNDIFGSLTDVFGNNFNVVPTDSGTSLLSALPVISSGNVLNGINTSLNMTTGTIGDIASNLPNLATGSTLNTNNFSENVTGRIEEDTDDFSIGGASTSALEKNSNVSVPRSSPERNIGSRIVTETEEDGSKVSRLEGQSTQIARISSEFKKTFATRFTSIIRDSRKVERDIQTYLNSAKFRIDSHPRQARLLKDQALKLKSDVLDFRKTQEEKFKYISNTQYRVEQKEKDIEQLYNDSISVQSNIMADRFSNELSTITQSWESIKAQSILPNSGTTLG
jgi:hypothetical protein